MAAPAAAVGGPLRLQGAGPVVADTDIAIAEFAASRPAEARAASGPPPAAKVSAPETVADGGLPEAPDLEAIPFFATGDDAFYVRADAGFGALIAGHALTGNGRFGPSLSGPAIVGVGAGYRFGYLLRADVTAEYRSRADIGIADGFRARVSGVTVLANLHADIGTWYGVTPYVSAGAGVSWNRLDSVGALGGSGDRTSAAWALGAGLAFELTPQVSLDASYRYLHVGTLRSPALAMKDAGSHDLRLGLRWWFGKAAPGDLPD